MTWKARIEWVAVSPTTPGVSNIYAVQTLTGSGSTVVSSSAAPTFGGSSRGTARITMISGAALVAINDTTPVETDSLRVAAGQDPFALSLSTGQVLSFVEAADDASNVSAVAPAPTSTTATISSGQAVSSAVQVNGKMVGIILPTGWTTAAVTFLGSPDDTTYSPIYDAGIERTIASADAVAGRLILLPLPDWLGVKFVKIRSGTNAAAVNQAAARTITIMTVA